MGGFWTWWLQGKTERFLAALPPHVRFSFPAPHSGKGTDFLGDPSPQFLSLRHCFAWTVELLKLPAGASSGLLSLGISLKIPLFPSSEISLEITLCEDHVCRSGNPCKELFEAGTWVGMGLLGNSTLNFLFPKCLQQCCLQARVWNMGESVLCSLTAVPEGCLYFLLTQVEAENLHLADRGPNY